MHFEVTPLLNEWTQIILNHVRSLPLIGTLLLLIIFDIITGISAAWYSSTVNSSTSFRGMIKKANMLFYVSFGGIIQQQLLPQFPIASLIAGAFICNEIISILENAAMMGIQLPDEVTKRLLKYNASKAASVKMVVPVIPVPHPSETTIHTTAQVSVAPVVAEIPIPQEPASKL